ncbi:hypothetical protein DdX_11202 [Ditylenchus destructor]|uniref:Uncharacterized protein n=1 Tax=Ditylenchus destructor TaxID=166010 RepID=A0AAD4N1L0_9BILA|nr:hypothetical protein DdX_11202 [Ditylenchus destructor]
MHFILSTLSLTRKFYAIFLWRPPNPNYPVGIYDPELLFWLGIPENAYLAVAPFGVLLLTVDRILTLGMPLFYTKAVQKVVILLGICGIVLGCSAVILELLMELPLDLQKSTPCETTMCVVLKSKNRLQLLMKLTIGTLNLFSSILLFYLLKKARTKLAVGVPSYNYFGNYIGVLLNMDAAICGMYYSVILLYRDQNHLNHSSRIVQVSKTSG